jgi:hypothetical protein
MLPASTRRGPTRSISAPPNGAAIPVQTRPIAIAPEICDRLQTNSSSSGLISTAGAERIPNMTSADVIATATTIQP